ncbi:MAG: glycosyltransferase [Gaiellaceae bacterium MAG52_C11]|nr:glycosyltransferase [Candidatus Gaiellasilicea maunaloa]
MRVTLWSPNYPPELTGIPPLVADVAEWLAGRSHRVQVVTAFPNYPSRRIEPTYRGSLWRREDRNGVRVDRAWLRVRPGESFLDKALYELTFSTVSLPLAARAARDSDVVVCVIPTLLAAAYARVFKAFLPRLRLILWVQDLVVEGAAALDPSPLARRALSLGRAAERFAVRGADRIVVCSPGFRDYLTRLGAPANQIEIVYNWADTEWISPAESNRTDSHTRFLYAGNVGYSQGLETLIDAAALAGPACAVRIVGDGNAAEVVRTRAATVPSVLVEHPVPRDDYPRLLSEGDVHVVIQRHVSAGANLPSKIATALASGRPVLASIDRFTPAAKLLEESGGALLVEPESPIRLAEAMQLLAGDRKLREELGRRGRRFAESRLSKRVALELLEQAIVG